MLHGQRRQGSLKTKESEERVRVSKYFWRFLWWGTRKVRDHVGNFRINYYYMSKAVKYRALMIHEKLLIHFSLDEEYLQWSSSLQSFTTEERGHQDVESSNVRKWNQIFFCFVSLWFPVECALMSMFLNNGMIFINLLLVSAPYEHHFGNKGI